MKKSKQKSRLSARMFPFLTWFGEYNTRFLKGDLIAGITVSVVLIPQSMAYAMLAGMPAVYGLYAATIAPMVGALWGSLRQMATGPIAIMSLLVLTTLSPLAEPGSPSFVELAFLLSFMVGFLYLSIGLFRLGEVMSFISHSAVKGFTAAAALIIIATQLPHFMGISVSRHEYVLFQLLEIVEGIPRFHLPTLAIGLVAFVIIYGIKKIRPHFPSSIVALVITAGTVYMLGLDQKGVAIVGVIPSGLPGPRLPPFDLATISALIGPAVVIALVSFAETYSVGKAISSETKQKLVVDQEFIGQGLANLAGSFFQAYPVSGSFSRTAINYAAGARTGLASVFSGIIVVVALLFMTHLFTYIPRAALAALVISAVLILFHPKEVFRLWKMNRHDGIVAICVFVLALLTKPDYALLIGVMISLMFFLWKTMHPRVVRITKDPDLNMFVNADDFDKPCCPQILQLRSDNSIYFANAEYTIEHIIERLDQKQEHNHPVKFLLLDLQAMGFIDMTGIDELRVLLEEATQRGVRVAFMGVHQPVMNVFRTSGFYGDIEDGLLIKRPIDALATMFRQIDHDYCRDTCRLELYYECNTVKKKAEGC